MQTLKLISDVRRAVSDFIHLFGNFFLNLKAGRSNKGVFFNADTNLLGFQAAEKHAIITHHFISSSVLLYSSKTNLVVNHTVHTIIQSFISSSIILQLNNYKN